MGNESSTGGGLGGSVLGMIGGQFLGGLGQAIFGEASVGTTSVGADALPVPFMPLWATITLAVALWVVVYLIRTKES